MCFKMVEGAIKRVGHRALYMDLRSQHCEDGGGGGDPWGLLDLGLGIASFS